MVTTNVYITLMLIENQRREREERRKADEYKREKRKQQRKKRIRKLLLKGDNEIMELNPNEKIEIIQIKYESSNGWGYDNSAHWYASINGKTICRNENFNTCIKYMLNKYNAKGMQLIPYSVLDDKVDGYQMIIKIEDTEKIEKETKKQEIIKNDLNNMAEKMTKEIQYAW